MLGTNTKTPRGFDSVEFVDRNDNPCHIACSSAIDGTQRGLENPGTSFLWIGTMDANPQVMCSNAAAVGLVPASDVGWQPYPIPEQVLLQTRMHLSREQVEGLIDRLLQWLATGRFSNPEDN